MHQNSPDLARVPKANVLPGLTRVGGLVHAIAGRNIRAQVSLAGTRVEDVRIGWRHLNRTNRRGCAGHRKRVSRRYPHPSSSRFRRLLLRSRTYRDRPRRLSRLRPPAAERTNHPPREPIEQVGAIWAEAAKGRSKASVGTGSRTVTDFTPDGRETARQPHRDVLGLELPRYVMEPTGTQSRNRSRRNLTCSRYCRQSESCHTTRRQVRRSSDLQDSIHPCRRRETVQSYLIVTWRRKFIYRSIAVLSACARSAIYIACAVHHYSPVGA